MRQFSKGKMMDPLKKIAVEGVAEGITIGMKVQKDRILDILDDLQRPYEITLRFGDMKNDEILAIQKVMRALTKQVERFE